MSEFTLWGYKAHLILEVGDRTIEVIDPMLPNSTALNYTRILEATEEARLTRPEPPKFKDVTLDV
jgi:hypothetical protein